MLTLPGQFSECQHTLIAQIDYNIYTIKFMIISIRRWYFLESSFSIDDPPGPAIDLWLDLDPVGTALPPRTQTPAKGNSNLLIGRANGDGSGNSHANIVLDDFLVAYGDRDRLERFDRIQRGQSYVSNELD